jgi:hypothetical protein
MRAGRPRSERFSTEHEEAIMSTVTREEVLERIAGLGPLQNVFLVAEDNDSLGLPIIWYPEIGLRYFIIIENDDLGRAVYEYLRYEARVRRFKSEREVSEAVYKEKWEGWDTCDDYRRTQQAMDELAKRGKK